MPFLPDVVGIVGAHGIEGPGARNAPLSPVND
jgi:hypothetical protein